MKETLPEYEASIALAKQLAETDTTYFGKLNPDQQKVLSDYYFARRDLVPKKDLAGYRELLTLEEVDIEARALRALGRLKQTAHVPH